MPKLYPVRQNGKWGYIDDTGRVVVPPRYGHAASYHDGRALVREDGKCLILDPEGQPVAESPFTHDHEPFSDGFAQGSIGLEFRFIDRAGNLLPGVFAGTQPFSEGLAAVCVNPARFDETRAASDAYQPPGKWGFANAKGELVIPANYYGVGKFSHGLAPVYVGGTPRQCTGTTGGKWGYVDKGGRLVIAAAFESAGPFSEGLAAVGVGGRRFGYIDTVGRFVIEPREFNVVGDFHDGLAATWGGELPGGGFASGCGYIDKAGKVVIPATLGYATDFSGGLAGARRAPGADEREWGYIDKAGKWVVPPQFDHALPFHGALAMVDRDGKIGYIDRTGRFVWPLTE